MKWKSLERPLQAPKQLLVEGRTPEIFFREWIEWLGLKAQMEVRDFLSLSDLTDFLRVFTQRKEFKENVASVGIMRDAEDRPALEAFASVCASLREANLPAPDTLGVVGSGTPRTGVFVLPDCRQPGMLETLCWRVLKGSPELGSRLECVEGYLDCLRRIEVDLPNEAKARVWAYLAAQGRFDPLVGRAAQAKVWDWKSTVLEPLTAFLKSL
jgi:hypothetical protein